MQYLFSEFTPSSYAQWKEQVLKDLKGESFESLLWQNENGFTVEPFYTQEHLQQTAMPVFEHTNWEVCEHVVVTDEKEANAVALEALQGGASGLCFDIRKPVNLTVLLKDISVEHIYTQFSISNDTIGVLEGLKAWDGKTNAFDGTQKCFVALDPLSLLAQYGEWHHSAAEDMATQCGRPYLNVNGSLYYEAGAYAATQLGVLLAHVNEYLQFLTDVKANIPSVLHVSLGIGSSFFTEIAKLKAARHLLTLLYDQYGVTPIIHIHAQTGVFNKSEKDVNTNLLRTTTESMSAVLGGCNSLTTLPFKRGIEADTSFSRRIARNQQLLLKGESYFDQLADVSSGSYYAEHLMDQLAERAWTIFKEIEAEGGFIKAFETGSLQGRIAADCRAQQELVQSAKKIMVGVNKFQNAGETTDIKLKAAPLVASPFQPIVQQYLTGTL